MNNHDFSQLNQDVRRTFATLGIHSQEELAAQTLEDVWADLKKHQEYFPDSDLTISFSYLRDIHRAAQEHDVDTSVDADEDACEEEKQEDSPSETESNSDADRTPVRALPTFRPAKGTKLYKQQHSSSVSSHINSNELFPRKHEISIQTKNNAMRSRSSFKTMLAAILTLIMIPSIYLVVIGIVAALICGIDFELVAAASLGYLLLFIAYLLFRGRVKCQVCHISTFSLRDYPRNKFAHNFLGLGYNISTALHIVFTLWFRCPACGTAVRLFKPKRKS